MSTKVEMLKYGRTLTDRPYGNQVAQELVRSETFPIVLDFKDVISLGSSFGDEILSAMMSQNQKQLSVFNANGAVKSCLKKVAIDLGIKVQFEE